MDNEGMKFVKIAVGVIMTLAVLGFLVYLFTIGQGLIKGTDQEIQGFQKNLTQAKFNEFDSTIVSGSQVINAIRQYSNTIPVKVKTSASSSEITYSKTASGAVTDYKVTDPAATEYINPTADFKATISKNTNGVVDGLKFEQK